MEAFVTIPHVCVPSPSAHGAATLNPASEGLAHRGASSGSEAAVLLHVIDLHAIGDIRTPGEEPHVCGELAPCIFWQAEISSLERSLLRTWTVQRAMIVHPRLPQASNNKVRELVSTLYSNAEQVAATV